MLKRGFLAIYLLFWDSGRISRQNLLRELLALESSRVHALGNWVVVGEGLKRPFGH